MSQQATPQEYQSHVKAGKDWKEIVAWVGDLEPLPHVAAQAIALIEDPDTTAKKLSDLLGKDPALAARVLKIANSAMFSCQREITTISQAIMIIGFKSLKGIVVAATLRQLNKRFGPVERMIWENSTCAALGAHTLATRLKKHYVDEVFLLGLLHDLGKIVLRVKAPKEYDRVLERVKKGVHYGEAESDELGFSSPLIGALVAKKWNFSPETCQVILHHCDPVTQPVTNVLEEKVAIIRAADLIAHRLGFGHPPGYPDVTPECEASLVRLGFQSDEVDPFVQQIADAFGSQGSLFN